jgi:hypothetical protein
MPHDNFNGLSNFLYLLMSIEIALVRSKTKKTFLSVLKMMFTILLSICLIAVVLAAGKSNGFNDESELFLFCGFFFFCQKTISRIQTLNTNIYFI